MNDDLAVKVDVEAHIRNLQRVVDVLGSERDISDPVTNGDLAYAMRYVACELMMLSDKLQKDS